MHRVERNACLPSVGAEKKNWKWTKMSADERFISASSRLTKSITKYPTYDQSRSCSRTWSCLYFCRAQRQKHNAKCVQLNGFISMRFDYTSRSVAPVSSSGTRKRIDHSKPQKKSMLANTKIKAYSRMPREVLCADRKKEKMYRENWNNLRVDFFFPYVPKNHFFLSPPQIEFSRVGGRFRIERTWAYGRTYERQWQRSRKRNKPLAAV